MKHYIDIKLLPSADIGLYFLWEKVFAQIHLGLARMTGADGNGSIGISIPDYDAANNKLGNRLRVLCPDYRNIEELNVPDLLSRLVEYVHVTGIRDVPDKIETYARYKRQQPKSNNVRMARRKAKREVIGYDDALNLISSRKEEKVRTPYINMNSQSTDRRFKLFIVQEIVEEIIEEGFSSYGLSTISTVPKF